MALLFLFIKHGLHPQNNDARVALLLAQKANYINCLQYKHFRPTMSSVAFQVGRTHELYHRFYIISTRFLPLSRVTILQLGTQRVNPPVSGLEPIVTVSLVNCQYP